MLAVAHTPRNASRATFLDETRASVNREGMLTAGPAKRSAATAPEGKPFASNSIPKGISKNVGNAVSVATSATAAMINPVEALTAEGCSNHPTRRPEAYTPSKMSGTVLSAMVPEEVTQFLITSDKFWGATSLGHRV